ncbi:hypothetical protein NC653_015280 [Populus alba x Populus x berolinensis]|uniref:Uncharacterized protein n=1 Tax=Populus alba x Populus x berolinensis TaxID=444605 RepID=A0AAD6QK72_9ROSI|nr:hypothetical protein NC653_015280 [Populus alba x Populus x berolinensis]
MTEEQTHDSFLVISQVKLFICQSWYYWTSLEFKFNDKLDCTLYLWATLIQLIDMKVSVFVGPIWDPQMLLSDSKDERSAGDAICDLHLIKKLSSVLPISTLGPFASFLLVYLFSGWQVEYLMKKGCESLKEEMLCA